TAAQAADAAFDLDRVGHRGRAADAEHEVLALIRITSGERALADRVAVHHRERVADEVEAADDARPEVERRRRARGRHGRALQPRALALGLWDLEAEGRSEEAGGDHEPRLVPPSR